MSAVLGPLMLLACALVPRLQRRRRRPGSRQRRRYGRGAWHSERRESSSSWPRSSPSRPARRPPPALAQTPPAPPPPGPAGRPGKATYKLHGRPGHAKMRYFAPPAGGRRARPRQAGRPRPGAHALRDPRRQGEQVRAAQGQGRRALRSSASRSAGRARCGSWSSTRPAPRRWRSARASKAVTVVDWQAGAGERGMKVLLLQRALARAALRHAGHRLLRRRAPPAPCWRSARPTTWAATATPPTRSTRSCCAAGARSSCATRRPASTWSSTGRARCWCWPRTASRTAPTTPRRARPPPRRSSAPSAST